jgi:hypothetical protein
VGAVQGLLAGSIGVIEEFFGAELVADDSRDAHQASAITPAQIVRLPEDDGNALESALKAHRERPVEDYRLALQSEPNGTRPTMLITNNRDRALDYGLRVVAYFGRILVDDPLSTLVRWPSMQSGRLAEDPWLWERPREPDLSEHPLYKPLAQLAEVRPLVAGGYIMLFQPKLAERFRDTDPAIAKENAQRMAQDLGRIFRLIDRPAPWPRTAEMNADMKAGWKARWADPVLDMLAASVGLGVDAMDTTGDNYVLRYLGEALTAVPTRLASVQLPRLELLPPQELAALLSSDEVLAQVRSALDDALRGVPEGLARDPELAARWVDERLAGNLEAAVRRLHHSIRRLPDAAKIGGAAGGVGATVLAGALTDSPALALGVGAAGAAADLTATWLHQWHQHNKQKPAIRVLTHLASRPQTGG